MTEQPVPQHRTVEGQAAVIAPGPEGQETMGGAQGQTPTGRKVEGQPTASRPSREGQETAWTPGKRSYRPNR